MRPRLLVLDNSGLPWLFREDRAWFHHFRGADLVRVNIPGGKPIPPLEGFSHLLISGSEASILQPRAWFDREANLTREAVERGMPILGSCFGHQMLVYALSGSEYVKRSPMPEIGWITIHKVADDELLADVPNPWRTMAYHFDEVASLPEPWRILARSDACPAQVVRYGDKPVWGIQPHPEVPRWKARAFLPLYRAYSRLFVRGEIWRAICTSSAPSPEDDVVESIARRFLDQRAIS